MKQFLLVKMKSADPYERGVQYGQQAAELIARGIHGYQRHFQNALGKNWEEITRKSALYRPLLERDFPEELEEARGIAAGSGAALDEILALNCRYEILKLKRKHPQPSECTTGAVLSQATAGGGVYMVQNWDYRPWVMDHSVVISIDNCQGTRIVGMAEAGQLVRNGLNNHGVGVCANNITSVHDTYEVGVPVTFTRRRALNQRSFRDACRVIEEAKVGVSNNYLVASAEDLAVDLEVTPKHIFRLFPERGIVTHANHMVTGAEVCTNKGRKFRDGVLRRLLEERSGKLDVPILMDCLKNHETFPGAPDHYPEADCIEAICSHIPLGDYDQDRVWQTIASAIYDITGGCAYICKGTPCTGEYVRYDV
jgi:isopenicillin-N N-acyltransferase-like protein